MITIIQQSKQSERTKKYELSPSETRMFLYQLRKSNFSRNNYFLFKTDDPSEYDSLAKFFVDDFFIMSEFNGFWCRKINPKIPIKKRIRHKGATITAIMNFKVKIAKEVKDSIILVVFENKGFSFLIQTPKGNVKLFCNYFLDIQSIESEINNVEHTNEIVRIVNGIFTKQRSYYKNKK